MNSHQIKQEQELLMRPPPGFAPRQQEGATINPVDENCNKTAAKEEVAGDDDDDDAVSEETPEPEPRIIEVPDPEFYDFDKDRTEECIAADEIWAVRDDLDAMPRLYALIRRIYVPFEVKLIWLDFVPADQDETAWDTSDLPVACGKFRHGDTATLEGIGPFSHRIVREKDGRDTHKIYPRKGEIWALYRNWNIKWSNDPDNHREYEYEFVEVLSDYTKDIGIMVGCLVKVQGFVSIFRPAAARDGMTIFQIPSSELLRFSHMVPSFRMTGKERKDVREGYIELDPASLPSTILGKGPDVVVPEPRGIPTSVPSTTTNACDLPESEFYVFDVDKSHDKFQTGQVWALRGELVSLPKYYARINKVESYPKFKLHIQWLEACTPQKGVIQWFDSKMPTCCGIFSGGKTTEIDVTTRFSHLAQGAVAKMTNEYEIYPRVGQVWAIHQEFCSELSPSDLQICQYDVGEVVKVNGTIKVLVLEKVSGYMTVFKGQKKAGSEYVVLEIPRSELLRFSHQMPAFQLTDEKEGTLRGCWKLDMDAMPLSLFDSDSSTYCKVTTFANQDATKEKGINDVGSNPDIAAEQRSPGPSNLENYETRKSSQSCKSKKRKSSEEKNTMGGRRKSIGGNSSTRYHKKRAEGASGGHVDKCKASTVPNSKNCYDGSTSGSKNAAADAKGMSLDRTDTIPSSVNEQIHPSPAAEMSTIPATEFCNFNDNRSSDKFKTGQIWALQCKLDNLPKSYARIESIELFPSLKLTIKWLELCHLPRGVVPWVDKEMPVSCGTFKVAFGEGVVFHNSIPFCHQVSGVSSSGNNLYTIFPGAGEVWALHSKPCSDLMCSNLKMSEYYMVEILELVHDRWIIISVLQSVAGFKTVFKAKEKDGLDFTAIPWVELYRFSHQVSSFVLKEARYGDLRGCWELDPRSMPVHLYSSNGR